MSNATKSPLYYGGIHISVDSCPRLVWDREKKVQVGSSVGRVGRDLLDRNWWGRQHPVHWRRAFATRKKNKSMTLDCSLNLLIFVNNI